MLQNFIHIQTRNIRRSSACPPRNMSGATFECHIVAMPYPGRGHVNPMLNLCRLILRSRPQILISFVLTEEWLRLLAATPTPNLTFHTIPNVIPSEIGRAKDFPAFYEAVITKMEAPVEQLLNRLPPPKPAVIIYDTYLTWAVALGNRLEIPVASFYTMSATVFSIFHHSHLFPHSASNIAEEGEDKVVDYIPGVPPMKFTDLPTPFLGKGHEVLPRALEAIHLVPKAQYLLFASVYELEYQAVDTLRQEMPIKIYSLGLAIPSLDMDAVEEKPHYMTWLDAQPQDSVLYISQGSFLSVSNAQLEEIVIGIRASGRFLWVGRGEGDDLVEKCGGRGLVVPWCDQLKVLSHPSVGGFWSHCGWNSTKEGAFAGLPMLTFPIFWDQVTNSRMIVEEWKFGLRGMKEDGSLVRGDEIAELVGRLMDREGGEAKERRRRAKEIQEVCRRASNVGGSSHADILAFIGDICGGSKY